MKVLYGVKQQKEIIKNEIKNGERISEIILGDDFLIHKYFFKTSYIAYRDIKQLYMRVEGGEYGDFAVEENSLVVVDEKEKHHRLHVDRKEYISEIMEIIKNRYPTIFIGK